MAGTGRGSVGSSGRNTNLTSDNLRSFAFASVDLLRFPTQADEPKTAKPVQILVWGINAPVDGRAPVVVDDAWADRLVANFAQRGHDFAVDYNHASLGGLFGYQDAPAAGWIAHLVIVRPADATEETPAGIWLATDWTSEGARRIREREYRYMSAVLRRDMETGAPLPELLGAALTNDPAISGLAAVAASRNALEGMESEVQMQAVLDKLGYASVEALEAALLDFRTRAAQAESLSTQLSEANTRISQANARVTALSAELEQDRLEAFIREGVAGGRIVPGDKGNEAFARELAGKDLALARKWLAGIPAPQGAPAPAGRLALAVAHEDDLDTGDEREQLHKKVLAYQTQHKVSYTDAYKAVAAGK